MTPRTLVCSDRCTPSSSETCVPFQNACTAAGHLPVSYGSTLQCADSCGIASTADACAAFKSACTAAGKKYESNGVAVYCNTAGSIPGAGSSRGGGGKGIFTPMVGIPGLDTSGNYTFVELINKLYIFLIAIGAVIGVIKIAFAGVKWATSASGGSISAAKEDIKGVLLGLIILMAPYLILSIINPKFTNLDVLKLKPLNLPATQSPGGGAPPNPGAPSNPEQYTQQCPGDCKTYTTNGCAQYEKDCKAVPGIAPYTTRGSKAPEFIHVCKVKPGTPTTQCPPGNGSTPGPQCEASGFDDCDDCQYSCSPNAEKPADNCVAWEQKCKSIAGAYVDKSSDDWECEIPEDTSTANCPFLKDLGTP